MLGVPSRPWGFQGFRSGRAFGSWFRTSREGWARSMVFGKVLVLGSGGV